MEESGQTAREPAALSAFEMLLVDISTRFIALPADRVDSEILLAQQRVCECLGVDASALWQILPDSPGTLVSTHVYVPADFSVPVVEMDAKDTFPWSMEKVFEAETVIISRMTDLPAAAARDLEVFRHYTIKSSVTFPLSAGGGPVFGAVSFDEFRKERDWSIEVVEKLRLVAQIFANALARKRADQAIRESEARYRGIFEESIGGIYRSSPEGKILVVNTAMANMLGYDSAETAMRTITDMGQDVWPSAEDRSRFTRRLEEQGTIRGHECQFTRKDGTKIWVVLNSRSVVGPDGRIACYEVFATDITERKRAEEGLRSSEERFRALAESALVGIYILQDGKYAYVNPAMARVFGYSVAEMTGMTPRDIVQPCDHGMVGENIRRRIAGEVRTMQYEVRGRYKDGSTRDVEVYGTGVEIDGRPALVGTLIDITARKQAEQALVRSRRLLAETEEIGNVGGWEIDLDTMKLTWTPEIYSIHEVDPTFEPTVEKGIQFYAPASRQAVERLVNRAIEHGEPYDAEMEIITAKGHLRTVHAIGRVDAEHRRVYGFFQDITAQKQNEREMAQMRLELSHLSRVLTLNEFSGSLAHEINQPLAAILNNAEAAKILLSQEQDKPEEIPEIVDDIIQDAGRAADVVHKLRNLVKRRDEPFEPLPVNALIDDVLSLLHGSLVMNKITLRLDLNPDLPNIRGDRVRLQQVVLNLVTNALEALKETPLRILTVCSVMDAPDMVTVSVGDSGPGIAEARREMVFQPFYTTKKDGLGLGLSICRSIIREHGGRIWEEDNPAGGATFSFSLKAWRKEPA